MELNLTRLRIEGSLWVCRVADVMRGGEMGDDGGEKV